MPTAANALLQMESGQTWKAYTAMTDSGDHLKFTLSGSTIWSGRDGYTPNIRPNGLITGGIATATATNNQVSISAMTLYLAGTLTTVNSGTLLATRATPTDTHLITSLTVSSAGALAAVAGAGGTAFSETRGANGGPPWIPTGSVEIGQVRLSASADAAIQATEIFQIIGSHQERADFPLWEQKRLGDSTMAAHILFDSTVVQVHSDDSGTTTAGKKVYAQVHTPIFSDVRLASDFKAPEESHSVSSKPVYNNKTVASSSKSLGQGAFTAYLDDGVTDSLVSLKNEILTFKFLPNKTKEPYLLSQGTLGIARTFPAGDNLMAACTISSETAAVEKAA